MSEDSKSIAAFEALIGLRFENPELLRQALTHSSYVNENVGDAVVGDNERLEFLGDAVIGVIVADLLYRRYPHISEGDLTQLRAALVKTESLADIAGRFRLGEFLLLGHGEEISGGRERLSTLCRGFEAVIGAIYLDHGFGAATDFVLPSLLDLLEVVIANDLHVDARSELQERLQAKLNTVPDYRLAGADGPEHEKVFRVEVALGDALLGCGTGRSKRAAAQAAAADALRRLGADGLPDSIEGELKA